MLRFAQITWTWTSALVSGQPLAAYPNKQCKRIWRKKEISRLLAQNTNEIWYHPWSTCDFDQKYHCLSESTNRLRNIFVQNHCSCFASLSPIKVYRPLASSRAGGFRYLLMPRNRSSSLPDCFPFRTLTLLLLQTKSLFPEKKTAEKGECFFSTFDL